MIFLFVFFFYRGKFDFLIIMLHGIQYGMCYYCIHYFPFRNSILCYLFNDMTLVRTVDAVDVDLLPVLFVDAVDVDLWIPNFEGTSSKEFISESARDSCFV